MPKWSRACCWSTFSGKIAASRAPTWAARRHYAVPVRCSWTAVPSNLVLSWRFRQTAAAGATGNAIYSNNITGVSGAATDASVIITTGNGYSVTLGGSSNYSGGTSVIGSRSVSSRSRQRRICSRKLFCSSGSPCRSRVAAAFCQVRTR